MRMLLLGSLLLAASLYAECTYTQTGSKVTWKAFKTYEKIGVGGSFDRVALSARSSTSVEAFLENTSVTIDTLSVNSGNPGRDAKLSESFFKVQGVNAIHAKIVSAKEGKSLVEITMNGITKTIPMGYSVSDKAVVGKGTIDLADFNMLPSLGSITKACYDLHAGKTWQDVEIGFEIQLDKKCL